MAMMENGRMTLKDICKWIQERFAYFRYNKNWNVSDDKWPNRMDRIGSIFSFIPVLNSIMMISLLFPVRIRFATICPFIFASPKSPVIKQKRERADIGNCRWTRPKVRRKEFEIERNIAMSLADSPIAIIMQTKTVEHPVWTVWESQSMTTLLVSNEQFGEKKRTRAFPIFAKILITKITYFILCF